VATALVAALVALAGILICRWLLHIPVLAPQHDGAWGDASTGEYTLVAAAVALAATALMYLLAIATPKPSAFFGWIIGLVTLVAVIFPFSTTAQTSQKLGTAAVNLVLGIAIGTLLNGVAARSMRLTIPAETYEPAGHPVQTSGYDRPGYDRPGYDRQA
jgi:hypothetical protein